MKLCLALVAGLLLAACGSPTPVPTPASSATPTVQPAAPPTSPPAPGSDVCHPSDQVLCALDGRVTQANLASTVCSGHWSSTVRPPVGITNQWKTYDLAVLPRPDHITTISQAEGDHRMPIGLGGDPGAYDQSGIWKETDQTVTVQGDVLPQNFSLQVPRSPNPKDGDETNLHDQICAGRLSLLQARSQLIAKWLAPFPGYKL
jgi:hypothetical protein